MPKRKLVRASSTTRTLLVIGDSWTLLILRNAFNGARRFGDWAQTLDIPRVVLADRLNRLVIAQVFEKVLYQSNPPRYEYRFTERGRNLWQYMLAVWDWEKRWVTGGKRALRNLVHDRCGQVARPVLCCAQCGKPVTDADTDETSGPGAGMEPRAMPRWQRRSIVVEPGAPGTAFRHETTQILGNRWSTQLLYAAARGLRRFGDFLEDLHISPHMLSQRLRELVALGILERVLYSESPARFEYRLSKKGSALYQLRMLAMAWGDRFLAGGAGPPSYLIHRTCGRKMIPQFRCSECNEVLKQKEFHFDPPLPAYRLAPSTELRRPAAAAHRRGRVSRRTVAP